MMKLETSQSGAVLDLTAFNRLFKEYQMRFIRFAAGYTLNLGAAEDIVMESFVAAWERREMLTEASFPPYTLTIVKNKCLNYLRGQEVRTRAAENIHTHDTRVLHTRIATLQACDPEELFSEEARRLVERALESLPARTREIFTRSRFHDQSYKEIAAEMDTTVKSVEFEVSKATKMLRIALKDYLAILAFWFYIN
ncbi:RNA polymerase sigma-70 factor [Alistipes montrealensis]|uniref:RNA polymerase sigma-70 factor n=1 Tax=Alistipes montrealensis TaxID=2834113 RepID=UPI00293D5F56|nr:RNA polymerase sigma-70 factor [Alistipes montrealensis]